MIVALNKREASESTPAYWKQLLRGSYEHPVQVWYEMKDKYVESVEELA